MNEQNCADCKHFNWVHENPNGSTKCNYIRCDCQRFIIEASYKPSTWAGWWATQSINGKTSTFSSWRDSHKSAVQWINDNNTLYAGHNMETKKTYTVHDFMIDDIIHIRAGQGADFIVMGLNGDELVVRLFGRHHAPTYTSFYVHPRNVLGFKDEASDERKKTQD